MSTKKAPDACTVIRSMADERIAMVYDGPQMVATLRRDGSGWATAYYRSGVDADGKSVWTMGPEREPVALAHAADAVMRLIPSQADERGAA